MALSHTGFRDSRNSHLTCLVLPYTHSIRCHANAGQVEVKGLLKHECLRAACKGETDSGVRISHYQTPN